MLLDLLRSESEVMRRKYLDGMSFLDENRGTEGEFSMLCRMAFMKIVRIAFA